MNELQKDIERPELYNVIRDSIEDARYSAKKLAQVFSDTIQPLRLEESEGVFLDLMQNLQDLECFMDFIGELKVGLSYFNDFGLTSDPISSENSGLSLFKEMHSAMESKDWIMLSDLIEYELSPLLVKEDEWLGVLSEKIRDHPCK
jgi:hypothetical protein